MDRLHRIIIALVALAVIGVSAWFIYDLYIRPKRALFLEEQRLQREAAAEAAAPKVDPSLAAFAATEQQAAGAESAHARELWQNFLTNFPDSPKIAEAQIALGTLNAAKLFSLEPSEHKTIHTVAKGDSLYKISRKYGTAIELIARANNLPNTMLQIGQQLVVPQTAITAVIDRKAGTLTLQNHGEFFRTYRLLSSRLPALPEGATAQSSVLETIMEVNGKRVAFGDKNYAEGQRSIVLSGQGAAIVTVPDGTPAEGMPTGLVLSATDMADVFVLLRRGVPITIK